MRGFTNPSFTQLCTPGNGEGMSIPKMALHKACGDEKTIIDMLIYVGQLGMPVFRDIHGILYYHTTLRKAALVRKVWEKHVRITYEQMTRSEYNSWYKKNFMR